MRSSLARSTGWAGVILASLLAGCVGDEPANVPRGDAGLDSSLAANPDGAVGVDGAQGTADGAPSDGGGGGTDGDAGTTKVGDPDGSPDAATDAADGGEVPTQVSGLFAWYKADRGVTFNDAGTGVVAWLDQSGAHLDARVPGGAAAPTLGSQVLNGKDALNFNGSATGPLFQYLTTKPFPKVLAQPLTIFTVASILDSSLPGQGQWSRTIIDGLTAPYSLGFRNHFAPATNALECALFAGQYMTEGTTFPTVPALWDGYFSGTSSTLRLDRQLVLAGAAADGGVSAITPGGDSLDGLTIGAGYVPSAGPNVLRGVIGEIILYEGALTDADRDKVETYLHDYWGTP